MTHRVVHSQLEFEGKLLHLRTDQVELPGGHIHQLELVEHPGAVAIVAIDKDDIVWLVRQYRHATGEYLLEIPAGTLDEGETPEECAHRECREEIGMAPGVLTSMGSSFIAPGYSTELLHFFLAQSLSPSTLDPDADEDLEIHRILFQQVWDEVVQGKIRDVKTIAGLALAREFIHGSVSED
jgi:ADP-ribose pyrophosphatase